MNQKQKVKGRARITRVDNELAHIGARMYKTDYTRMIEEGEETFVTTTVESLCNGPALVSLEEDEHTNTVIAIKGKGSITVSYSELQALAVALYVYNFHEPYANKIGEINYWQEEDSEVL